MLQASCSHEKGLIGFLVDLTSVVFGLLIFVALLISLSFCLVWLTLLLAQCLPSISKDLADLAEADAGVLFTNILTLVVGEEHVGRKTTLGRVGVFLLLLDTTSLGLGCCFGAGLGHGFGGGFRFGVSRCLGSFWWHLGLDGAGGKARVQGRVDAKVVAVVRFGRWVGGEVRLVKGGDFCWSATRGLNHCLADFWWVEGA